MTTANRLKQARRDAKLKQKQVYEALEVPIRTLQDWEAGKRTPPPYVLNMLLEYYKKWHLKAVSCD